MRTEEKYIVVLVNRGRVLAFVHLDTNFTDRRFGSSA